MPDSSQVTDRVVAGRYRLLESIGRGGMGTVWRAHDEILGREVAVKELIAPPELTGPEREIFSVRTFREARAAGRVGHPGVAAVYDVFEESGHPWIVLQLVPSNTLGAVVRDQGPLPPARVAEIGLQVLSALRAAHQAGVLHRDVKPDNVLLAHEGGRAVLTDFGIATLDDDSPVTRTGTLIGTPAFIAPERAAGGQATRASDLWSLGVTLYVAAEGRSPFQRGNPLATLGAVMHDPPAPLRLAGPIGPVLMALLRKDPAERLTATEAEGYLRMVAAGIQPEPTAPATPVPPPIPVPVSAPATDPTPVPALTTPGAVPPQARPGAGGRGIALAGLTALIVSVGLVAGGLAWVTARSAGTALTPTNSPTVRVTVSVTPSTEPVTRRTPQETYQQRDQTPSSRTPTSSAPAPEPTKESPKPDKTKDKGKDKPSPEPTPKPTKTKNAKGDDNVVPPGEGEAGPHGDQGGDGQGDSRGRESDPGQNDGRAVIDHGIPVPGI
ncbi:protein kinase domain-containing protein [Sphaerisporangium viridialbum]|uniref:serine/threonine-protein kinase n=1 Tax=Sphaerisporangium viridialbum TaxID=46189 RepID=UPI003C71B297